MGETVVQTTAVVGAGMILAAYGLLQLGRMGRHDPSFNLLNLIGSLLLTVVAVVDLRWGFIMLEACWAVLSLAGLLRPRPLP